MNKRCVAVFAQWLNGRPKEEFRVFHSIEESLEEYATCLSREDIHLFHMALRHSQEDAIGVFQTPDRPGCRLRYIVGVSANSVQDHLRMVVYHNKRIPRGLNVGVPAPDLT